MAASLGEHCCNVVCQGLHLTRCVVSDSLASLVSAVFWATVALVPGKTQTRSQSTKTTWLLT